MPPPGVPYDRMYYCDGRDSWSPPAARSTGRHLSILATMSGKRSLSSPDTPLRVAVLTNMIAPYTTQIFERLAAFERCELVVVYETAMEPNRSWETPPALPYRHVVLRSLTLDLRRVVPEAFLHVPWRPLAALKRFRPDVVVAGGGAWTSPTNLAALQARRRGRWAFVPVYESTPRTEPSLLQRAARPFSRRMMGSGDAWIVSGSRALRRVVELGADPERTFIAPTIPSLPLDAVEEVSRPVDGGRPFTYLYVGRLVEEKGLRYLVEAIRHVPNGRLWLAGEGPLRAELEATSPPDRVQLFGHLGWSELQRLYREADALVFPSLYDVWGLVVNEALAHGLPVIASDQVGAVDDLIEPGVNGLVVPARSAPALAKAMRELATWDEGRRERGAALGREKVAWYRPEVAAELMLAACDAAAAHAARRNGRR
jgi:glycosyltransferase involved in cell wall biosynthesis